MKIIPLVTLPLLVTLFSACATVNRETSDTSLTASEKLEQHTWLQNFVGTWKSETEIEAEAGQPSQKLEGTATSRSIGGFWIVTEIRGESPMGKMEALLTIGYDPERQRFVGSWIDSVYNHMWIYSGSLDVGGKTLSLESEGPSFSGDGSTATYKDTFEFKSKDHYVLTSWMMNPDGTSTSFMSANYRRSN